MQLESQPRESENRSTPQFVQTIYSPVKRTPSKSSAKRPQIIDGVEENNLTFMEPNEPTENEEPKLTEQEVIQTQPEPELEKQDL